ncbi:MAG TPA: Y-family DNA polymerase [Candidatus Saccharimonadales bacterium]|nr:Y-family DNA polymerase [Candidatus Saccharimonadales bacterium]
MGPIYALVDCNNFFVSCERLFRPELHGRPVVVLSSNDGCAVSRSQEAKDLDIPMGAPHFKYREFFAQHGVISFSANFELYGDISERITNLLASITPNIEVYSVDESFLDLSSLDIADYTQWGRTVRATILQNVGIPVSIGIASSKTLAKLANNAAKKQAGLGGALDLTQPGPATDQHLARTPVADIWGVGWRLGPLLRSQGIHSALDLRDTRPQRAQQLMGIHGRQMQAELSGVSCSLLKRDHKPQQMIMRGRQFGEDTREFHVIESAVASLGARAAAALRRERQLARQASVMLSTNRHKPGYQRVTETVRFYTPTADTGSITSSLVRMLSLAYNPRLQYHKADVLLHDFVPESQLQTDLFGTVDVPAADRSTLRMHALDRINLRHGKGSLCYAAETLSQSWQPRKRLSSPRYTSQWNELPEVRLL